MHNVIDFIPRYYAFRLVALSSPRPSLAILSFVLSSLSYLSIRLFDSKRKVDSFAVKYRCLPGEFGRARNGMLLKNAWTRALFRGYFFRCALFYDRKIVMVWGLGNKCRWEVNFFMYTRVLSFLKNSCRSILTHFLFLFFDRSRYPRDIERLPLITQGTKFLSSFHRVDETNFSGQIWRTWHTRVWVQFVSKKLDWRSIDCFRFSPLNQRLTQAEKG